MDSFFPCWLQKGAALGTPGSHTALVTTILEAAVGSSRARSLSRQTSPSGESSVPFRSAPGWFGVCVTHLLFLKPTVPCHVAEADHRREVR